MVPIQPGKAEYIIQKSEFISFIYPLQSAEEAKEILKKLHSDYYNASHICYALRYQNYQHYNDDGEPSSTAGLPLYNLLITKDIDKALLVVIRYFGGIKLGTGPLARAYATAGKKAIEQAKYAQAIELNKYFLKIPYNLNDRIQRLINQKGKIINIEYNEEVNIHFAGDLKLKEEIKALSNGIEAQENGKIIILKEDELK